MRGCRDEQGVSLDKVLWQTQSKSCNIVFQPRIYAEKRRSALIRVNLRLNFLWQMDDEGGAFAQLGGDGDFAAVQKCEVLYDR